MLRVESRVQVHNQSFSQKSQSKKQATILMLLG